ncbi:extracellular solute-binding protein [Terribacillus sp. 179-K 1B1 HS]|uniref:extracellular solute-binding protein n=1 Tax=Terribacillus sp. 179-K 1B1 HS TaxID=3142388 RepID=UPI0039A1F73B
MKSFKKVLYGVVLGAVLLSGCSGEQSAAEDYGLSDIRFPVEEDVTLKFMIGSSPMAPEDPNDKLISQRLEKETGVHIEWDSYSGEVFTEKRNLAMSSGDLPDAIMNSGYSDYELLNLADDGAIIPVEDLIEEYMPNLQKVFEQAPEYKEMVTAPDGHIYSFPWIEELGTGKEKIQAVDGTGWINVKWLEDLGLEMPQTTEELREVLIAFRDQDPAGGGKTIPMSFILNGGQEDPSFLFGSFGVGDNWDHTVVTNDREVVFTPTTDGYKETMKYLHDLYKENLIDVEAFEQDWNNYVAKGGEERFGVYFTWDKNNISGENYEMLPALEGPQGHKNVAMSNAIGFDRSRMVITSANQNLELTAKWIDQMYDPLQSVQNNWGTYGDKEKQNIFAYDESENMLKHLELEGTAPVELREQTSLGGPLAILDSYYGEVTTMPDDAAWRMELMHDVLVPDMNADYTYPNVFHTLDNLEKISKIEADLIPYVERKRSEWIVNGNVENEWNDHLDEMNRLGLEEWLEIKQFGFDEYMKAQEEN